MSPGKRQRLSSFEVGEKVPYEVIGGDRKQSVNMMLADRVAIVTGGARGLGKAFALSLFAEGAKVVIADTREAEWVNQVPLRKQHDDLMSIYADVSEEESTQRLAQETIERFGRIDILINNAAVSADLKVKPFHEISGEEWDKVMQVNLRGNFLCCKAVFPQMKKQRKGKIINVASGTVFGGAPSFIHYITSKAGVIGFTRALAREVGGYGICVNAIAPGLTVTEVNEGKYVADVMKGFVSSRCLKRVERPEDLTGAVLFLSCDGSDFITGQTILIDGGSSFH